MNPHRLLLAAAIACGTAAISAQTPIPWPLGCPVPVTVANNGLQPLPFQPCWPVVTDPSGQLVSMGLCQQVVVYLDPGDTFTTYWGQHDFTGQPVPAGLYHVGAVPYDIGAVDIALRPLGAPHPGATRAIELCAPNRPHTPYLMAAAFSSAVGIPLGCGHVLPLDDDALLAASLGDSPLFEGFFGVLDANGRSDDARIAVPAETWLVGITFQLAAMTLDPLTPCGIGEISAPTTVTIT